MISKKEIILFKEKPVTKFRNRETKKDKNCNKWATILEIRTENRYSYLINKDYINIDMIIAIAKEYKLNISCNLEEMDDEKKAFTSEMRKQLTEMLETTSYSKDSIDQYHEKQKVIIILPHYNAVIKTKLQTLAGKARILIHAIKLMNVQQKIATAKKFGIPLDLELIGPD